MDKIELNMLPPHAFIIMTIYFLQNLEPKVIPCLIETILDKNDLNIENETFDYDLFEKKMEDYVRFSLSLTLFNFFSFMI